MEIPEKYKTYRKETSRHCEHGTIEIMYKPWNHFDVVEIWAKSSNPLESEKLGYGFWKDFPDNDKYIEKGYSVGTDISTKVPKDGIKITILSYEEAVRRANLINWD